MSRVTTIWMVFAAGERRHEHVEAAIQQGRAITIESEAFDQPGILEIGFFPFLRMGFR